MIALIYRYQAYLPHRHDVTVLSERLRWQHHILKRVCGQMPKAIRENVFSRLPKFAKIELEQTVAGQQINSLSIDVSPPNLPIHFYTGMEALLM